VGRTTRLERLKKRAARYGIAVAHYEDTGAGELYKFGLFGPPEQGAPVYEIGLVSSISLAETWLDGVAALYTLEHYDVPKGTERGQWWLTAVEKARKQKIRKEVKKKQDESEVQEVTDTGKDKRRTDLVGRWLSLDSKALRIARDEGADAIREYVCRELRKAALENLFRCLAHSALDSVNWERVAKELAELD